MANMFREHKLIDSTKRALVKYVMIADGSGQQVNTLLLDSSNLAFSLNTTNQIMTSNTDLKSNHRITIKRLFGTSKVAATGIIKLQWHGAQNSEIVVLNSGNFDFNFEIGGDSAVISNPETSSNGDILISTVNLAANDNMTLFVDVRKDNRDFSAGQHSDPTAFNFRTF